MFRLSEAAIAFAKLNRISDEDTPALDKSLRNLTQRNYLPRSAKDGRADLYSIETLCALRLAERALAFGIDRKSVNDLLRFLQIAQPNTNRYHRRDGVKVAFSIIEEAVERARNGEDFAIGLVLNDNGRIEPKAWFLPEGMNEEARTILTADGAPPYTPDAVFRLDAGRLIRAVLAVLDGK